MIIEKLPEIANAVAQPLAKTEKIVIVDQAGKSDGQSTGAAKVTGYVTDIVSQLPETIEAMTGINFMDALKGRMETTDYKEVADENVKKNGNENTAYQSTYATLNEEKTEETTNQMA